MEPSGQKEKGRPRNTWRRELEAEMSKAEYTWKELEAQAKNRVVDGLRGGVKTLKCSKSDTNEIYFINFL